MTNETQPRELRAYQVRIPLYAVATVYAYTEDEARKLAKANRNALSGWVSPFRAIGDAALEDWPVAEGFDHALVLEPETDER